MKPGMLHKSLPSTASGPSLSCPSSANPSYRFPKRETGLDKHRSIVLRAADGPSDASAGRAESAGMARALIVVETMHQLRIVS